MLESSTPGKENNEKHEKEFEKLQKENFEEHEKWQLKLKEVVSAMQKKGGALKEVVNAMHLQRNEQTPENNNIHILIIVLGGGMQGAYGAGQIGALAEMGYTDKYVDSQDTFLGLSVGAPICAFGMAGIENALKGAGIFYTKCLGKDFINYFRLKQIMNVEIIEQALRNGQFKLDIESVHKNPAKFYVQAYNKNTNSPELINAKDPNIDMINAIHASMAIPIVYDKEITIGKSRYTDGAFNDPLPLARAIEKFKPTHILILPNTPFNKIPLGEPSNMERAFLKIIPDKGSLRFIRKVLDYRQELRRTLDTLAEHHGVKIGIAWPPEMGLHTFIQDKEKIKVAIETSAKEIFNLFGEEERSLKLYE